MKTSMDTEQQSLILNEFLSYLNTKHDIDFVWSEKFGYIYISRWGLAENVVYDAVLVRSSMHLCEILMDIIVYEHLAQTEQVCMSQEEAKILYDTVVQPYSMALPAYQQVLESAFQKVAAPVICRQS